MNIQKVTIERFKRLRRVSISLSRVTVLTGPNNSGKSSVLQAVQFTTSIAQSAKAYSPRFSAGTLAAEQLMYSPLRDVEALAPNGVFTQSRINAITISFDAELAGRNLTSSTTVIRGKNRNLSFTNSDNPLGNRLGEMDPPFSVYVTGLAGIPRQEEFRSEGLVRKAASRGDANSVLRNVLLVLSQDAPSWQQFLSDLRQVFPDIDVTVHFDAAVDDYIDVKISFLVSPALPIDAAGTGVLQTIQILAYVNVYKPALLLLDEPDSHLHPTNQRRLARVLTEIATRRDFQVLLTTHSRHLLDEFSSSATTIWFDAGQPVSTQFDFIQALIDLGALDQIDTLGHLNAIILTEDEDITPISTIATATLPEGIRYEIRPYSGSSKIDNTLLLSDFIREKAPHCTVIVHRDRDYATDEEMRQLSERLTNAGIVPLITTNVDVESPFLNADHLHSIYPLIPIARSSELLELATNNARHTSIERLTNARVKQEAARVGGLGHVNHGQVAQNAQREYDANPLRFRHGKTVLGHLTALLQAELGVNPNLLVPTPTLAASGEGTALSQALA
jgi:hypothetical protein